jgi:hypothetical protein
MYLTKVDQNFKIVNGNSGKVLEVVGKLIDDGGIRCSLPAF